MAVPLACVEQRASASGWQPTMVYTVRVRVKPWRLPSVRVSSVLAQPERRFTPRPGASTRDRSNQYWWGSTGGAVAKKLATVWSSVVEAQKVWSHQSYQTLQRVGSKLLRSASLDRLLSAAGDEQAPVHLAEEEVPGLGELKASLSRFITTASKSEVSEACMLADLSNLAYDVGAINHDQLQQVHSLKIVRSSLAPSTLDPAPTVQQLLKGPTQAAADADAAATEELEPVMMSPRGPHISFFSVLDEDEVLGTPQVDAAHATALEDSQLLSPMYLNPVPKADSPHQVGEASAESLEEAEGALPPADWFVCDSTDPQDPTRYFVIQGSITLDHWRINLTIDPVPFEDGSTGVMVHRGVYLAALDMYDTFVPLVREHLASAKGAKVAFTGHSLGGSLATVLMLLLVNRGVLPPESLATVHTFGAPAVFCEGASHAPPLGGPCGSCSFPCDHRAARTAAAAAAAPHQHHHGLLEVLALGPEAVTNIIMTRDIVPRAFVCDYTMVADVLKSWSPSFKQHVGLAACKPHKVLYNFVGNVEVLQPDLSCGFVLPDEGHFMLPQDPALYKLTEPHCALNPPQGPSGPTSCSRTPQGGSGTSNSCAPSKRGLAAKHSEDPVPVMVLPFLPGMPGLEQATSGVTDAAGALDQTQTLLHGSADPASSADAAGPLPFMSEGGALEEEWGQLQGRYGDLALGDAILAFMNSPHPLETLCELRAYGPSGSISRFHNPANYHVGLATLSSRGGAAA